MIDSLNFISLSIGVIDLVRLSPSLLPATDTFIDCYLDFGINFLDWRRFAEPNLSSKPTFNLLIVGGKNRASGICPFVKTSKAESFFLISDEN